MTDKETVHFKYDFFTYKTHWENTKIRLNINDEELRDLVESALQMYAWADILTEVISAEEYDRLVEAKGRVNK